LVQLQALHDRAGRPHTIVIQDAQWFSYGASHAALVSRLSEMTRIYVSSEPERLPAEILEGVVTAIALGEDARVPSRLTDFGSTERIGLGGSGTGSSQPAGGWVRANRRERGRQATADEVGCGMSRPPAAGSASAEDEIPSLSG